MEKMIFLNVGWMKYYQGLSGDDDIEHGAAFINEHGYGHEIYNFQPYKSFMYGFVQVKGSINITRLGASVRDPSIDDVLAVWVAPKPTGGTFIVGWYGDAVVYRQQQDPPEGSKREYAGEKFGFYVKASMEDCTLLPVDQRVFQIPRGKGGLGQALVWYADQPVNAEFQQKVLAYTIYGETPVPEPPSPTGGGDRQTDPLKRQRVEKRAVEVTIAYYRKFGYFVDSVEKDNIGWDLEATFGSNLLRLEVKGLSGKEVNVELTPNEYEKMQLYQDTFRICIVADALGEDPKLRIFSFSPDTGIWEDDEGNQLETTERTGARLFMV